jgi:hypothetical protein
MTEDKKTTQQVSKKPQERNPEGKGGFGDNPKNRNPGGWKKENTISYQYNRFMNMDPDELAEFADIPNKDKTVAMEIAYQRVLASKKSLADVKEITDRTEGKAPQNIDLTSGGEQIAPILVKFIGEDEPKDN